MKQTNKQPRIHHEPLMVFKLEDVFNKTIENVKGNIVYRIVHNNSGRSYVGITKNGLLARFNGHRRGYEKKYNHPLYNSINKYGIENFSAQILHICNSLEEMDRLEEESITYYKSFIGDFGFNKTRSGKDLGSLTTKQLSESVSNRNKLNWQDDSYRNHMIKYMNSPERIELAKNIITESNKKNAKLYRKYKIQNVLNLLKENKLFLTEYNYNSFIVSSIPSYRFAFENYPELFTKKQILDYKKHIKKYSLRDSENIKIIKDILKILNYNLEIFNEDNFNKYLKYYNNNFDKLLFTYQELFSKKFINKYSNTIDYKNKKDLLIIIKIKNFIKKLKELNLEINQINWNNHSLGIIKYETAIKRFPNLIKNYGG